MSRILVVGNCALDIVSVVDHYPLEDEEMRAVARHATMGGNAANTATALTRLGHHVSFAGNLADDADGQWLQHIFSNTGIDTKYARTVPGVTPASMITVNVENGSRTIIHYRNLPEYSFSCFRRIPLSDFDWLHFEGRYPLELRPMLDSARSRFSGSISLEIEKHRPELIKLLASADVGFFSPQWMKQNGYADQTSLLHTLHQIYLDKTMTCTGGSSGAWGIDMEGRTRFSPAVSPERVVDTVAAGDVFNAAMIHGLLNKDPLEDALALACRIAGEKTGRLGLDGIGIPCR